MISEVRWWKFSRVQQLVLNVERVILRVNYTVLVVEWRLSVDRLVIHHLRRIKAHLLLVYLAVISKELNNVYSWGLGNEK